MSKRIFCCACDDRSLSIEADEPNPPNITVRISTIEMSLSVQLSPAFARRMVNELQTHLENHHG